MFERCADRPKDPVAEWGSHEVTPCTPYLSGDEYRRVKFQETRDAVSEDSNSQRDCEDGMKGPIATSGRARRCIERI